MMLQPMLCMLVPSQAASAAVLPFCATSFFKNEKTGTVPTQVYLLRKVLTKYLLSREVEATRYQLGKYQVEVGSTKQEAGNRKQEIGYLGSSKVCHFDLTHFPKTLTIIVTLPTSILATEKTPVQLGQHEEICDSFYFPAKLHKPYRGIRYCEKLGQAATPVTNPNCSS